MLLSYLHCLLILFIDLFYSFFYFPFLFTIFSFLFLWGIGLSWTYKGFHGLRVGLCSVGHMLITTFPDLPDFPKQQHFTSQTHPRPNPKELPPPHNPIPHTSKFKQKCREIASDREPIRNIKEYLYI